MQCRLVVKHFRHGLHDGVDDDLTFFDGFSDAIVEVVFIRVFWNVHHSFGGHSIGILREVQ